MNRLIALLILTSILVGCTPATQTTLPPAHQPDSVQATETIPETKSAPWWRDAVFYEIFVRSFYDSNGDGIGDFNGIIQKLDYIQNLGANALWLMPIFPSPSYHGYDVTDYYSVNPQYGTIDDFKNLVTEAHKRGIRVIIDLVINHTSDQHPWFKSAKKNVNSPYRDWYIWSETDPKYVGPWGERVWHSSTTGFYYGIFESFMPDLNYNNPEVTVEMTKIYSFWLNDVGIDGFRLDAAKHLIEENSRQQNTTATHEWYQQMHPVYKEMDPNAMTVGELFGDGISVASRYVKNNEFDLIFNFQLASTIIESVQTGRARYVTQMIETSNNFLPEFQYAPFLTNHDQNRVMRQLQNDMNKAKVAASLMLTAPGTPFIYYGEEIGMSGSKPDENIRKPMQWSSDKNAGFTTGKPWRLPDTNFSEINVMLQSEDTASMLSHYRSLIRVRTDHASLRTGKYYPVDSGKPGLYVVLRVNEYEIILVLVNLSDHPISDFTLTLDDLVVVDGKYKAETLLGDQQAQPMEVTRGGFQNYKPVNELLPYSTLIVQFAL